MLSITIPGKEIWNEKTERFTTLKEQRISLEHSLVSLHKWEAKWHKPFMGKDQKTIEESIDYIRCMTITPNVPADVYEHIDSSVIDEVTQYINNPMTATWFSKDDSRKPNHEVITAEIIYFWMIQFHIPFECRKWHLNQLLTLIRVCDIKNGPKKNMSKRQILSQYSSLNAARRKALHTKG